MYFDAVDSSVGCPVVDARVVCNELCQIHRAFPSLEAALVDISLDVVLAKAGKQVVVVFRVLCH